MKIILYKSIFLNEGIEWTTNQDGTVSLYINQDQTDDKNKGTNSADTRVFGDKVDVLYGDGTGSSLMKSMTKNMQDKISAIQFYNDVIRYINKGRNGEFRSPEGIDPKTIAAVRKWFDTNKSDNYIKDAAKKSIQRLTQDLEPYMSTYQRVSGEKSDRVARYMTGKVQGTNVPYIALFSMTDFNFSDAIKHGNIRQNGNTDNILGISSDERKAGSKGQSLSTINIKYDNNVEPDIKRNFSLDTNSKYHQKQSFGINDKNYTSINQFIDKSVNYAAYALKHENFSPDFIVTPPSSSNFNKYYCTNLSRKLNIPFIEDFYERNLINVKFDKNKDPKSMKDDGFSDKDIMEFEYQVKNIAYKEIAYEISQPIRNLINTYKNIFSEISVAPHSREKVTLEALFDCLMIYVYRTIINQISGGDVVEKQLVNVFMSKQNKLYNKEYDSKHIFAEISSRIKLKIGKKVFNKYMIDTYYKIKDFSKQLEDKGYELRFDSKRFKITQLKKQFRPYLHDVYIVADKYTHNNKLTNQFKTAKFLIFDEDINSGATLKLCIDALFEKIPENNQKNVMCLVNAFSQKGW